MACLLTVSSKHFILLMLPATSLDPVRSKPKKSAVRPGAKKKNLNNSSWRLGDWCWAWIVGTYILTLLHQSVPRASVCINCGLPILLKYTEHLLTSYFKIILYLFVNGTPCVEVGGHFVGISSLLPPWIQVLVVRFKSHTCGRRHLPHLTSPVLFLLTWERSSWWHWLLYHITYRWFRQSGAKTSSKPIDLDFLTIDHQIIS